MLPLTKEAAASDASALAPQLSRFCIECHGDDGAEARLNLEQLGGKPDFGKEFRTWENVIQRLRDREMPPPDALQPDDDQRRQLIEAIAGQLAAYIERHAGDPGPVVMRRLTSAEYAYSIEDLTGVKLNLDRQLVSDAVGGEGFTNVGEVQFVQDAALERYLEAAKTVAAHAVIGSGPLEFFVDPGKTGRELSAIHRIQQLYREHGFRTAAGEGAEPFGLELYPTAFYVAWRFRHRQALGRPDATLATLAAAEGLEPRFAEYVSTVVNAPTSSFPTSEIVAQWRDLPAPDAPDQAVRQACRKLYDQLYYWQHLLASATSDEEEAAVLTAGEVDLASEHSFEAALDWPEDATSATLELSVLPVQKSAARPLVQWRNPRMRLRRDRRWTPYQPLRSVLSPESAAMLHFGRHPAGVELDRDDFVLEEIPKLVLEFAVPAGATSAEFQVDVSLDLKHGDECVVRCNISDGVNPGETVAATGTYSALLADPDGASYRQLKPGIEEFARKLPEVSHREPAPADRDPIPAPIDNTYNSAERNHFHTKIKYHRDDEFLVQHLLNDEARRRLDHAWTDLLTSFDYHDEFFHVVAQKYGLPGDDLSVAELDAAWIASLPAEPRAFVQRLYNEYLDSQRALAAAKPEHVEQALEFAERAWRRPLSEPEQERLRAFYARLRQKEKLEHESALRLLLARILVAPAFLYRAEAASLSPEAAPLSDWELASRLSYFLWSSVPDDELRRAAASGELQDPQQLARQARRMVRDPKARRLAAEFFGQWFGFYRFDTYRGVDNRRFPEFTDSLKGAMYDEAVSFFEHIVREDRPLHEILFADYTFVDAELARHYGLPATTAEQPVRVEGVDQQHRGGLLRLGAVLTVTSAPLRTSPVKRGDWILRRVLGTPVPPPPADAGSIAADDVQGDELTLRQRLEVHRREASCVNCHSRMDPLGFALEHYDAIGRWREHYRDGQSIDSTGVLNDGVEISGPAGLHRYLKDRQADFHRTLSTRLLGYALGRTELASDRPLVKELTMTLEDGGKFSDLAARIVTSKQFRYRLGGEPASELDATAQGEHP
jgi:hypothetical protein